MATKNNPFLYWDIETGDKTPENASILSISYSRGQERKSLYASPAPGTSISKWAMENVWEPIKQRLGATPTQTEEEVLRGFLGVLQSQKGGTIAGWNIGYVASPMDKGTKGFDIPFIMSRAGKYPGLREEFSEAFNNVSIRDIGREFSVRIAQEVSKYPELVDPKLHAQAQSFTKLVNINRSIQRLYTVPDIAEWMGTPGQYGGYEIAGWKLKDIYQTMFGESLEGHHLSDADVAATARIAEQGDLSKITGPEWVANWNRTALQRKAEASVRAGEGGLGDKIAPRAAALIGTNSKWYRTGSVVNNWIRHNPGKTGIGLGVLALLAIKPLQYFSGKDDNWNTIEGLRHGGIAEKKRRELTDFGSGYQDDDNSSSLVGGTAFAALGGGVGYAAMYPWSINKIDLEKYPRLAAMRKVGSKRGMKIISSSMAAAIGGEEYNRRSRFHKAVGHVLFGEIEPVRSVEDVRGYAGVAYYHGASPIRASQPVSPLMANWGEWDIGVDKLKTWNYMKERNAQGNYADTLAGSEFYSGAGKDARLSDAGRKFIEEAGGVENLVVKRNVSSLGEGVWTNAAKMPKDVAEEMLRNPGDFHLQKRIELANEFRVITAGDKAVYSAHRFGTENFKKAGDWLSKNVPNIPGIGKLRWNENLQPVLDTDVRNRLHAFAENAAKDLPYEIGAFDIGMTKEGTFKIIEAQRSFGSITNPIVSRRIRNVITGKPGMAGVAAGVIGAAAGLAAYGIIWGKDDAHNTIEGLSHKGEAGANRKNNTDFGSGFTRRAWNVFRTVFNEANRSIAHTVKHKIVPGAVAGKPLELGVVGISGFEAVHTAMAAVGGTLTPGGLAIAAASFAGSKYAYMAIKGRKAIKSTVMMAASRPIEAQMAVQMGSSKMLGQIKDYVFKGHQNEFSTFAKFGGGDLGRQALVARLETSGLQGISEKEIDLLSKSVLVSNLIDPATLRGALLSKNAGELSKYRPQLDAVANAAKGVDLTPVHKLTGMVEQNAKTFSALDDKYNIIEGLKHGGVAEVLRKAITDFGSGWIRRAISMGVSEQNIISGIVRGGVGTESTLHAFAKNTIDLVKSGNTDELIKYVRQHQGITMGGQRYVFGKRIAEGGFGKVMEAFATGGARRGEKFVFKKVKSVADVSGEGAIIAGPGMQAGMRNLPKGQFLPFADEYMAAIKKSTEPWGNKITPEFEAKMQMKAREKYGDLVPEVLGFNKSGILMEHAGSALPIEQRKTVLKFIDKEWNKMMSATDQRVVQFDPHVGQVLRRGGKLRIVDWGASAEVGGELATRRTGRAVLEEYSQEVIEAAPDSGLLESFKKSPTNTPRPLPEPAMYIDRQAWLREHKKAAIMASRNAKYGGKGHSINPPATKMKKGGGGTIIL